MSQWRSPEMYRLEKELHFVWNKTHLVLHWVDELRIAWFNVPVKHNLLKMKGNSKIKWSSLKERMVLKMQAPFNLNYIHVYPWQTSLSFVRHPNIIFPKILKALAAIQEVMLPTHSNLFCNCFIIHSQRNFNVFLDTSISSRH